MLVEIACMAVCNNIHTTKARSTYHHFVVTGFAKRLIYALGAIIPW